MTNNFTSAEKENYYAQALEFTIRAKKKMREFQNKESIEDRVAWLEACSELRELVIASNIEKPQRP